MNYEESELMDFIVDRINRSEGLLDVRHLPGHMSQLKPSVRGSLDTTRMGLMKFLKQHPETFTVNQKGFISLAQNSKKEDILQPFQEEKSDDDESIVLPSKINDAQGVIIATYPTFGFIAMKQPVKASVHFTAHCFGERNKTLLGDFQEVKPGKKVCFNATRGNQEFAAKYKATRIWFPKDPGNEVLHEGNFEKSRKTRETGLYDPMQLEGDGKVQKVFENYGFIMVDDDPHNIVFFHKKKLRNYENLMDLTKIMSPGDQLHFEAMRSSKKDLKVRWEATKVWLKRQGAGKASEKAAPASKAPAGPAKVSGEPGRVYPNSSGVVIKFGGGLSKLADADSCLFYNLGSKVFDVAWEFGEGDEVKFDGYRIKSAPGWKAVLAWIGDRPNVVPDPPRPVDSDNDEPDYPPLPSGGRRLSKATSEASLGGWQKPVAKVPPSLQANKRFGSSEALEGNLGPKKYQRSLNERDSEDRMSSHSQGSNHRKYQSDNRRNAGANKKFESSEVVENSFGPKKYQRSLNERDSEDRMSSHSQGSNHRGYQSDIRQNAGGMHDEPHHRQRSYQSGDREPSAAHPSKQRRSSFNRASKASKPDRRERPPAEQPSHSQPKFEYSPYTDWGESPYPDEEDGKSEPKSEAPLRYKKESAPQKSFRPGRGSLPGRRRQRRIPNHRLPYERDDYTDIFSSEDGDNTTSVYESERSSVYEGGEGRTPSISDSDSTEEEKDEKEEKGRMSPTKQQQQDNLANERIARSSMTNEEVAHSDLTNKRAAESDLTDKRTADSNHKKPAGSSLTNKKSEGSDPPSTASDSEKIMSALSDEDDLMFEEIKRNITSEKQKKKKRRQEDTGNEALSDNSSKEEDIQQKASSEKSKKKKCREESENKALPSTPAVEETQRKVKSKKQEEKNDEGQYLEDSAPSDSRTTVLEETDCDVISKKKKKRKKKWEEQDLEKRDMTEVDREMWRNLDTFESPVDEDQDKVVIEDESEKLQSVTSRSTPVPEDKVEVESSKASVRVFEGITGKVTKVYSKFGSIHCEDLPGEVPFFWENVYRNGTNVTDHFDDLKECLKVGDSLTLNCFEVVDDSGVDFRVATGLWRGNKPSLLLLNETTPKEFILKNNLSFAKDLDSLLPQGRGEDDEEEEEKRLEEKEKWLEAEKKKRKSEEVKEKLNSEEKKVKLKKTDEKNEKQKKPEEKQKKPEEKQKKPDRVPPKKFLIQDFSGESADESVKEDKTTAQTQPTSSEQAAAETSRESEKNFASATDSDEDVYGTPPGWDINRLAAEISHVISKNGLATRMDEGELISISKDMVRLILKRTNSGLSSVSERSSSMSPECREIKTQCQTEEKQTSSVESQTIVTGEIFSKNILPWHP